MEALTEFVSITQASEATAKQFLQAFDNDVQAAVEAFFEDPDKYSGASSRPAASDFSDDEGQVQDEYVRAPIQPVRKRLIADDMPVGRGRGGRNQQPSEAFRDLRSEQSAMSAGRGMNKKSTMLADLFRPPLEVLFKGTFEKASATAAAQHRWLLLNIQDPGIFDCQLINRDTWADEALKATIKASFIMVQLYVTSEQAEEYTNWHSVGKLPHIAILDPETGERKWFHDGLISAAEIKSQFAIFLEENPVDVESVGPVKQTRGKGAKVVKDLDSMTEDEQMAWVIQQSLNEDMEAADDGIGEEEGVAPPRRPKRAGSSGVAKKASSNISNRNRIALDDSEDDSDFEAGAGDDSDEEIVINDSDSEYGGNGDDEPVTRRNVAKRKAAQRVVNLDVSDDEEDRPAPKRAKSTGYKLSSSIEPVVPPKPAPESEPEPVEEEELDDEPEPEGTPDCTLQLRLPGGASVVKQFHSIQKLKSVAKFVRSQLAKKVKFTIATTFPRRLFTPEELQTVTLKDAGLVPRAVLIVEES